MCLDCNCCLSADIIWWFQLNALFVLLAIRPWRGLCWWSISLQPSGNNEGSSKSLIQEWPSKTTRLGVCVILNRPSESTDLFFCQTNNRFHFCFYLGDNYASAPPHTYFLPLSISHPLSLSHICCIVLAEGQLPQCALNHSRFTEKACIWEACSLWGKTEMSSLIFCRKLLVLFVSVKASSDIKWALLLCFTGLANISPSNANVFAPLQFLACLGVLGNFALYL